VNNATTLWMLCQQFLMTTTSLSCPKFTRLPYKFYIPSSVHDILSEKHHTIGGWKYYGISQTDCLKWIPLLLFCPILLPFKFRKIYFPSHHPSQIILSHFNLNVDSNHNHSPDELEYDVHCLSEIIFALLLLFYVKIEI
jgi:hypothetical protein